ncbi:MAG: nuclear transport factor 2 family protein [Alphaproteobacteria bacterium]
MSQSDAVLFANEAFYRAFADRRFDTMKTLWAKGAPVSCIHPGWGALAGRDQVLSSWEAILGNPDAPDIACVNPVAQVYGEAAAVICNERIGESFLIATNVFVREEGRWLLVHRQAGPVVTPPETVADEPPTVH